jgi:hypothetical protein
MRKSDERFEVRIQPKMKAKLAAVAAKEGVPLGEMLVRLACRAMGFDEEAGVVPRLPPGRKPSVQTRKER